MQNSRVEDVLTDLGRQEHERVGLSDVIQIRSGGPVGGRKRHGGQTVGVAGADHGDGGGGLIFKDAEGGGAKAEALRLGLPFLGEIPLDPELRKRSDAGEPIVATAPDSPHTQNYRAIAQTLWAALEQGSGVKPAPRIVMGD